MKVFNNIQTGLLLLALCSLISCNNTNWNENFKEKNKSPFGTYILYHEVGELFKNQEVTYLKENIYDYLFHHVKDTSFGNYICIKPNAYKLDEDGFDYLLAFINEGDHAFLSLNNFSEHLSDSLQFSTKSLDEDVFAPEELKHLKGALYLENPLFKEQPYLYDRNIRRTYFDSYNKNNSIVLGTIEVEGVKQPNFIKIPYGKGAIFLHSNPVVFTNYNLLNGHENYVENVLSYLPAKNILWDPQIKSSNYSNSYEEDQESIFKFFFQHPSLTWFLGVSFLGLILFMLFNARRKQRAIPIIKPLQNSTVEFAQTISNLYLQEEDHKNLVDKKIAYFLEKIRDKYLINTSHLNTKFIENLALKSNNELQGTRYLINTIIALNKKHECSENELIILNKMIENFFKK